MEKVFYKKSLTAKLVLERGFTLESFGAIKDFISTFVGVSTRASFDHELITYKRKTIGMVRVSRKNVVVALGLNPKKIAKKYKVIDASSVKSYAKYPTKVFVTNKKSLNNVLALIEKLFEQEGIVDRKEKEVVDFEEVYYDRTFLELFNQGYIKQYIRNVDAKREAKKIEAIKVAEVVEEENEDLIEDVYHKVTFTAKLVWCATGQADDLYILNNVDNWDFAKAVKMTKVDDNTFTAFNFFKDGTKLEFKICRKQDWENVEKGIWKEEIVNHHYLVVNNDLEVEDLIHNFRID
ncbi:MAG: CBM20 domain-containing protein [Bacilli bacterium]